MCCAWSDSGRPSACGSANAQTEGLESHVAEYSYCAWYGMLYTIRSCDLCHTVCSIHALCRLICPSYIAHVVCACMCIHVCIHMYRERQRDRQIDRLAMLMQYRLCTTYLCHNAVDWTRSRDLSQEVTLCGDSNAQGQENKRWLL